MSSKVLIIVHQKTSVPGHVGVLLEERGYELDRRCPNIGDPLPEHLDDHDGVVVFGGPMSANDDHLDGIRAELDFMDVVLREEKPFFGICLGGQLLARALGARVYLHDEQHVEIGYTQIHPTDAGKPYFEHSDHFYQWHKEGFDLPEGATLLAEGRRFPNQAYLHGENALGIQFHPEITLDMIKRWSSGAAHKMEAPGAQPREAQIKGFEMFGAAIDQWGRDTLDWLGLRGRSQALMDAAD